MAVVVEIGADVVVDEAATDSSTTRERVKASPTYALS